MEKLVPLESLDSFPSQAAVYNTFALQRHLVSCRIVRLLKANAANAWQTATAAAAR